MLVPDFLVGLRLGLCCLLLIASAISTKAYRDAYQHKDIFNFQDNAIVDVNNGNQKGPPKPDQAAQMARYIVHNSDWASVATISSMPKVKGFPFANILSVSDGLVNNSSGIPFLYITPIEMTTQDLLRDNRCSLSMTLAQGDYCKQQDLDPEDPRCAHVILTGKMRTIKNGTSEAEFAKEALFTRHPVMKTWPKDHSWYFVKLKIEQICVMDYFGGPKFVKVQDYFNALPDVNVNSRPMVEAIYV